MDLIPLLLGLIAIIGTFGIIFCLAVIIYGLYCLITKKF